jgi:hypothetical protein
VLLLDERSALARLMPARAPMVEDIAAMTCELHFERGLRSASGVARRNVRRAEVPFIDEVLDVT